VPATIRERSMLRLHRVRDARGRLSLGTDPIYQVFNRQSSLPDTRTLVWLMLDHDQAKWVRACLARAVRAKRTVVDKGAALHGFALISLGLVFTACAGALGGAPARLNAPPCPPQSSAPASVWMP